MDWKRQPGPRLSADALGVFGGVVTLFGSGVMSGVGLSHLIDGALASGGLLTLLGAAMAWAALRRGPASPEA
jgi:hypothetical protein